MTNDAGHARRLDESWDANAQAWTTMVRERRIESRRAGTDNAIVDAVLRLQPDRVLDVGCGEGWLCRELARSGIACTGVDRSADLIAAARSADPRGQYEMLAYDGLRRIPELTGAALFDVAVCNFSLLHDDIQPILMDVRVLLRPGGALLIQTVHPWAAAGDVGYADGWRNEEFAWSELPFPEPMPWYFRTLESWVRSLSQAQLRIDRLTEPLHPESGKPLSLILCAVRSDP